MPRILLFILIFVYSIPRQVFSYIVLGHYPVTNSIGMCLKLNYDFSCCKAVVLTVLKGLSGTNVSNISKTCCIVSYLLW